MLAILLRPLGLLSLAAVSNGAFANIRFRNSWHELKVRADDALGDRTGAVQQVSEPVWH